MGPAGVIGDLTYSQYNRLPHVIDGASNSDKDLLQAAQHFESLFIDMWLKSAREANRVISKDNIMQSNELELHEEMRDHEMAVHMSRQGGIGLAEVIVRQLRGGQAAPADGTRQPGFETPQAFVSTVNPMSEKAVRKHDLPPMAGLSQAALETGWGQKIISDAGGNSSHNLFGIKAQSTAEPNVRIKSREFDGAQWQNKLDHFKRYPDWQSSINDYVEKLSSSERYAQVLASGASVDDFAQAMGASGYATDPDYAQKLLHVHSQIAGFE